MVTIWVKNADSSYRPVEAEPIPGAPGAYRILDPDGSLARQIKLSKNRDTDGPPSPEYGPGDAVRVDSELRAIGLADLPPEEAQPPVFTPPHRPGLPGIPAHAAGPGTALLKLYVGVRFFSGTEVGPFDIRVLLDGQVIADGAFPSSFDLKSPDSVSFFVPKGRHVLEAATKKGNATFRHEFTVAGSTYALLDYNHYPRGHPSGEKSGFTFESQGGDYGWR